jgi:hypothetical protein
MRPPSEAAFFESPEDQGSQPISEELKIGCVGRVVLSDIRLKVGRFSVVKTERIVEKV